MALTPKLTSWWRRTFTGQTNSLGKSKLSGRKQPGKNATLKAEETKRNNSYLSKIISLLYHWIVLNVPELTMGQALTMIVCTVIIMCMFHAVITTLSFAWLIKMLSEFGERIINETIAVQERTHQMVSEKLSSQHVNATDGTLLTWIRWLLHF